MQITAAVVRSRSGDFHIETLDLCDPRADELLVGSTIKPILWMPH